MASLFSTETAVTAFVSAISLLAVWVPLYRGLKLSVRARAATRRVPKAELAKSGSVAEVDSFSILMVRVLAKSLRESGGHPAEFVIDATRQYVQNEYEANYSRLISMYANLLPPIGFIGTTTGMLILFFSMHASAESLELGALALALTSSIFALIGFAILEAIKIRLYGRLLVCIDDAAALGRTHHESQAQKKRQAAVAAG